MDPHSIGLIELALLKWTLNPTLMPLNHHDPPQLLILSVMRWTFWSAFCWTNSPAVGRRSAFPFFFHFNRRLKRKALPHRCRINDHYTGRYMRTAGFQYGPLGTSGVCLDLVDVFRFREPTRDVNMSNNVPRPTLLLPAVIIVFSLCASGKNYHNSNVNPKTAIEGGLQAR